MACLNGHSQAGTPKEAFKAAQEAKEGVDFVEKILSEQVFPRMIKLEEASKSGVATVYEKAYSHEHLEKTLRIEAALDARLDKQMARFVNLKEYKRIRKETSNPVLEAVPIAAA
jgi:ribosomal protein S13